MIVLSLVQNFALLVALAVLFQRLGSRLPHVTLRYRVLSGLLFGAVALVGMATPVRLMPGIIFDGRSIILAVAGIFGGPLPAAIAAGVCAAYRLALGGAGAAMGLAVITEAALIGVGAEALRRRRNWPRSARFFLVTAVAVHVTMLACVLALPGWASREVVVRVGPSILFVYPLAMVFVCLLFQDFEEQARDRAALRESEARYRELFQAHPQPMWVYDLETLRFLTVNDAMVRRYGWSREELLGMTTRDIRPPEELAAMERRVAHVRANPGYTEAHESRHRTSGGRVFEVETSSHDIDFEGRQGRVVVAQDVSDRRRLEEQLRQAQKMEAVGVLAGGIAHDFNNLLQATLSAVQAAGLQAAALPSGSALGRTLAEVEAQVQRGAQLTRQLLLFSRQSPSLSRRCDLAALVVEQSAMLRRLLPETVALEVEDSGRELPVEGDAGQLAQVVANLVVNARDAMPGGGRVQISTRRVGDRAVLEVRDNGVGIAEAVRVRIFDPFYTTKAPGKGTGLGLAVVWGIVREHGGTVEVESEIGRGSTFRVLLPIAGGEAGDTNPPADEPEGDLPAGRGERILLVEDETGARHSLIELLTILSYRVTAVASSEEALAIEDPTPFDGLLTDLSLPGDSGLDLARVLTARWPKLRVVVMSGYAPDDVAHQLFEAGTVRFLQKPFDMAALARALREALAEPSGKHAAARPGR
ncbi:MAG: ATP-binding protein [Acidobacteriota bacterium]